VAAGPRIALGVTGGIAAYKAAEIVRGLTRAGAEVHVIMTAHAREFITPLTLQTLSGQRVIADPWDLSRGADIQHIALTRGLDLLLVAPATADILAKFAHGIADDFLSTFYLAVTAPVAVAPAMNLWMWEHPATRANLETLAARGVRVVDPGVGELACGEEGIGRMAEPEAIVEAALALIKSPPRVARIEPVASPATDKKKLRARLRGAASS
jgi:phosphopantothenoylcysteine decarboxylase/phosphopantothenate--cysteine ligase